MNFSITFRASYDNSINLRTGNYYSPAEKFEQIARYDFTKIVSEEYGLGLYEDYPAKHPNECVGTEQHRNGKCIPGWVSTRMFLNCCHASLLFCLIISYIYLAWYLRWTH